MPAPTPMRSSRGHGRCRTRQGQARGRLRENRKSRLSSGIALQQASGADQIVSQDVEPATFAVDVDAAPAPATLDPDSHLEVLQEADPSAVLQREHKEYDLDHRNMQLNYDPLAYLFREVNLVDMPIQVRDKDLAAAKHERPSDGLSDLEPPGPAALTSTAPAARMEQLRETISTSTPLKPKRAAFADLNCDSENKHSPSKPSTSRLPVYRENENQATPAPLNLLAPRGDLSPLVKNETEMTSTSAHRNVSSTDNLVSDGGCLPHLADQDDNYDAEDSDSDYDDSLYDSLDWSYQRHVDGDHSPKLPEDIANTVLNSGENIELRRQAACDVQAERRNFQALVTMTYEEYLAALASGPTRRPIYPLRLVPSRSRPGEDTFCGATSMAQAAASMGNVPLLLNLLADGANPHYTCTGKKLDFAYWPDWSSVMDPYELSAERGSPFLQLLQQPKMYEVIIRYSQLFLNDTVLPFNSEAMVDFLGAVETVLLKVVKCSDCAIKLVEDLATTSKDEHISVDVATAGLCSIFAGTDILPEFKEEADTNVELTWEEGYALKEAMFYCGVDRWAAAAPSIFQHIFEHIKQRGLDEIGRHGDKKGEIALLLAYESDPKLQGGDSDVVLALAIDVPDFDVDNLCARQLAAHQDVAKAVSFDPQDQELEVEMPDYVVAAKKLIDLFDEFADKIRDSPAQFVAVLGHRWQDVYRAQSTYGDTVFHLAAEAEHFKPEVVLALLKHGFDPTQDAEGRECEEQFAAYSVNNIANISSSPLMRMFGNPEAHSFVRRYLELLVNNVTLHLGGDEHSSANEDESRAQWDAVHMYLASLLYDIFDTLDNIDNVLNDVGKLIEICRVGQQEGINQVGLKIKQLRDINCLFGYDWGDTPLSPPGPNTKGSDPYYFPSLDVVAEYCELLPSEETIDQLQGRMERLRRQVVKHFRSLGMRDVTYGHYTVGRSVLVSTYLKHGQEDVIYDVSKVPAGAMLVLDEAYAQKDDPEWAAMIDENGAEAHEQPSLAELLGMQARTFPMVKRFGAAWTLVDPDWMDEQVQQEEIARQIQRDEE
eukprot:TRINITY_DN12410_c0_g5_i1.p1 TRINITY_DN12410_c0_g5~~TRINITY_DN12410_c0_g5_i1.p1  ORF type:complete len:1116 (+),score=297.19 TRINITY_DN12410_c0_g5_i1:191-3349(+)